MKSRTTTALMDVVQSEALLRARIQKLEAALRIAVAYIPDGSIPVELGEQITEALNS
jgi:hypothetical protein